MSDETIQRELPHSASFKRNNKGEYTWENKIYYEDINNPPIEQLKAFDTRMRTELGIKQLAPEHMTCNEVE